MARVIKHAWVGNQEMAKDAGDWHASLVRWTAQAESADGEALAGLLDALMQAWGVTGWVW